MTKKTIRRLVVKVGTSTLTYATGNINFRRLGRLVETLSDVAIPGIQVVLVSSGAIAVGVGKLGLPHVRGHTGPAGRRRGGPKRADVPLRQALFGIFQNAGPDAAHRRDIADPERRPIW